MYIMYVMFVQRFEPREWAFYRVRFIFMAMVKVFLIYHIHIVRSPAPRPNRSKLFQMQKVITVTEREPTASRVRVT